MPLYSTGKRDENGHEVMIEAPSINPFAVAYEKHRITAYDALRIFRDMCDYPVCRVPGMDTVIRLAWRIECGKSVERAALDEWLYRVSLSIDRARVFDAPCLLGL